MRVHEGGYYVALELYDRPGAVAAVATALANERISIESIVQRAPAQEGSTAHFILITHNTLESAMRAALAHIEKDGHVAASPRMIRIERL
jgi:homoserine dehydrogenase